MLGTCSIKKAYENGHTKGFLKEANEDGWLSLYSLLSTDKRKVTARPRDYTATIRNGKVAGSKSA